jgi:hypothetical protein
MFYICFIMLDYDSTIYVVILLQSLIYWMKIHIFGNLQYIYKYFGKNNFDQKY